jgi:hypothetical protein
LGIRIAQTAARERLEQAFEWASSDQPVPEAWREFTELTFRMTSKTYTPALGTVLLARATDDRIDPLSIKAEFGPTTYSLRTLGHEVLVPAARRLGFSIRNTGREPLNNQPFFRYDHMSVIDRVRDKPGHARFVEGVKKVNGLSRDDALSALAAFLRVAIEQAQRLNSYTVDDEALTAQGVIATVVSFLSDGTDLPRKVQALVAAAFDVTHDDVRSRKLNDPSRDYPGDVHAFKAELPILAVEARAKRVSETEVAGFVAACRQAEIERAFVVVLAPSHRPLPLAVLRQKALDEHGVLLTIFERPDELLFDVFIWSDQDPSVSVRMFVMAVLERLREIEAKDASLAQWAALLSEFRSSQ